MRGTTTRDREQPAQTKERVRDEVWDANFSTFMLLSSPLFLVALRVLGDELVLAMARGL